jgi:hypothetical protein
VRERSAWMQEAVSHNHHRIAWYQDYQRCIEDTLLPLLPLIW